MHKNTHINTNSTSPNIFFMPSVYNDAMTLLCEAQEYFTVYGDDDQNNLSAHLRPIYNCEMSRITLRLSCIMSWILARRSVLSGEISDEQASHYGLEFHNICRVDNKVLHGILPSYVCYLLDSTLELYERVLRMDSQVTIN